MLIRYSFLLLIILPFLSVAQQKMDFGPITKDTLPEKFHLNLNELREYTYGNISAEWRNDVFPRKTYRFADNTAMYLQDLFSSGRIYTDLDPIEKYVNEILEKVVPPELKANKYIHAYIVKNSSPNAFMTGSGSFFLNIGLLAEVENEAALAGVIAHELAHYQEDHSLKAYVKRERGDFKPGIFLSNQNAANNFSIQNELDADSLALHWLNKSGYNVDGLAQFMELAERNTQRSLLLYKDLWEFKETTHPRSEKRINKLSEIGEKIAQDAGASFLINAAKFKAIKTKAKSETLQFALDHFEYNTCIEKAFKYHLIDPNNTTYIYYLMEALRRACYLNKSLWNKKFITHRYHEIIDEASGKKKVKLKTNLFKSDAAQLLAMSEAEFNTIEAKFYWEGNVRFESNEEAFLFFNQVAELLGDNECILTNALSLSFDPQKRNELLKKYLAKSQIKHREFAQNLLDGTIKSALNKQKLTVFSDIYNVVQQGRDQVLLRDGSKEEIKLMNNLIQLALERHHDRKYIYLPELKGTHLSQYVRLKEIEKFSYLRIRSYGDKTELHVLDPAFWETMKSLNTNEIEFVQFKYFDARKMDKSLEGYKQLINTTYAQLFAETKRNRYIDLVITSVRAVEGGIMKYYYRTKESKLDFKDPGYDQLIDLISNKLHIKQERLIEQDAEIRKREKALEGRKSN